LVSDAPDKMTFHDFISQIEASLVPMNYAESQAVILALTNVVDFPKSMLDRVSIG